MAVAHRHVIQEPRQIGGNRLTHRSAEHREQYHPHYLLAAEEHADVDEHTHTDEEIRDEERIADKLNAIHEG